MKPANRVIFAMSFTVLGLVVLSPASADPKTYEWETIGGWLFSPDQAAIEAITGQPSVPLDTSAGLRHFVAGAMRGTFTYDPANAIQPPGYDGSFWSYAGANRDWYSELETGAGIIGSYAGAVGPVIVTNGNDGPGLPDDLVNVRMCNDPCGTDVQSFSVGDWAATGSSVVWRGEGYLANIALPAELPPVNGPTPLALFSFYNQAIDVNVNIVSFGLEIREVGVQTVDIDVKPGSEPNCFNVNGHGVIPVAILGSPELDVADIDQASLSFGELAVGVRGNRFPMCATEHVNADDHYDLVCQFADDSSAWSPGDGAATLKGQLLDGTAIEGSDSICLRP